jgi:hypothetical protein
MRIRTSLTLHAIKTLTFMSEFCQVAVVGEARAPPSQSIYDGPPLANSPQRSAP